jgi:hypothetical protein
MESELKDEIMAPPRRGSFSRDTLVLFSQAATVTLPGIVFARKAQVFPIYADDRRTVPRRKDYGL